MTKRFLFFSWEIKLARLCGCCEARKVLMLLSYIRKGKKGRRTNYCYSLWQYLSLFHNQTISINDLFLRREWMKTLIIVLVLFIKYQGRSNRNIKYLVDFV
jgi:hypothetical protein